jgi:sugar/nucleoside kinase (ribokinase family)
VGGTEVSDDQGLRLVALVGQSVLDRVTLPSGHTEERLGGAPVFAGHAIASDGRRGVILTKGGTAGLRRPLHEFGLRVVEGPDSPAIVSEMWLHSDGARNEAMSAIGEPFTTADVDGWMAETLDRCCAVVCGAQWCDDFPPATIAALARGGRTVYLDGQGPARPARLGPLELSGPLDPALVRGVTVLKLGLEEADALIGGIDADAARATGVPVVVVTLAERGAVVLIDGEATPVGVDPVHGLADTVGAGDMFLALMAAAATTGCDPITATQLACDGVSRLLRRRLEALEAADAVA